MQPKWWEYYAVRYFAGTVIGAVIIAFLIKDAPFGAVLPARVSGSMTADFFGISLAAGLGFSFCYVASSPMLTFHAARAHIGIHGFRLHPWWMSASVLIPIVIAAAFYVWFPIRVASAGVIIGVQVWLILIAAFAKFKDIESFYRKLATARSEPKDDEGKSARAEFVESYRHLREHGNAVSIVILEFVLAFALMSIPSIGMAALLIVLWLVPSVFAWLLGTVLERRFAEKPL